MKTETIKLPHGYTAEIATDEIPGNPFEDWDGCEPVTCFDGDRPGLWSPDGEAPETLASIFDRIPASRFRTRKGRESIAQAAGIDLAQVSTPETPGRHGDEWKEAMAEALPEEPYRSWRDAGDYFDALESLCRFLSVPCFSGISRGYCQGDAVRVFVMAPPEWVEKVGAGGDLAAGCKATFDLFTAWAWGDVYGVASIRRPNGEELEDGSCWGFYGSDHEASGLLGHCRGYVAHDRARRAALATARRAARRRERAAAQDAACRDIATV